MGWVFGWAGELLSLDIAYEGGTTHCVLPVQPPQQPAVASPVGQMAAGMAHVDLHIPKLLLFLYDDDGIAGGMLQWLQ
ncbi:uncharacterized protein BDCG_06305 [Blastomyces dermatitidis ER-3]|uniref:Uncharacterized protein n=1 Tax=Ajellomyces dermatitidis (strain ER-3 / ATCC MYA-2586) TaxID=559297 RepID=A0ABP2F2X0_AJEDR|nr:uncharacterized protein BDCG_06305 [Blastomyces dermatitidis ER-3]EEQ91185.2 hypothetical protein BDCG_06305 [Blastomyces dermatitidis ER-3]